MKSYYRKIFIYILAALVVAVVFLLVNSGALVNATTQDVLFQTTDYQDALPEQEMEAARKTALVLYDPVEPMSVKYKRNLERVFRWLKMEAEFLPADRKDTVAYPDYDMVMVAFSDWECLIGQGVVRLARYVNEGGRLLLGMMPEEPGIVYSTLYRSMGVLEYGNYGIASGFRFSGELMPGSQGRTFEGEAFEDSMLNVQLEQDCLVLMVGLQEGREVPMVWRHDAGQGRILTYNGTGITGDLWTGVAAGCIQSLMGEAIWPVINAKTIFIDDFPSPQYNTENEGIQRDYNRTVLEFYRDIWWPAMQSAAVRYNLRYVGLFMATYNDIVNPEAFAYTDDPVEQYFGNSLMDNGFEMGLHGYNHQPLVTAGQTPEDLGYKPWSGRLDMAASLEELVEIAGRLFPGVKLYTYVPPSNYLSEEGRQAVVEAMPDLRVISGVYTNEEEDGAVYVQDFGVAEDGIVELPRATSGMLNEAYDNFAGLSVGGLYGIFSHFVHPDDILDEERGQGKSWEELFREFCQKLQFVNESFSGLRPMTAIQAAGALEAADHLEVTLREGSDGVVEGLCNGFSGQGWCYLRTERTPKMINDTCRISPVSDRAGSYYYLVQIDAPVFSFALE